MNDLPAIGIASARVVALGLVDMAKIRMDEKAYDEAAKLCRESLEFEDTPETHVEMAIVSIYAKQSLDAIEQASLATDMDPQNDLAWKIKGEALLLSEDYVGAATALSRSLALKQDAESNYALAIAHLGVGQKQSAAADFSQFLTLVGDRGWSRLLVGKAYQEAGMPAEAEAEFSSALRLEPLTANAHYYWAVTLLQKNSWSPTPEVKYHLQEELKLNPRHILGNYLLGFFASNERNFNESDRYLHLAAELDPSLPEAWLYLGLNAYNRGASRLSETYLRKAISLTKDEIPTKNLSIRKAYYVLGRILFSTGRKKESEGIFQKVRELETEEEAKGQKSMASQNENGGESMTGVVVPFIPKVDRQNSLAAASGHDPTDRAESRAAPSHSPQSLAVQPEEELRAILGSSFNDLATAEALQEKYALAVKHYREAATWDSRIPGLQRNLGLAAFFVGEYAEAIHLLGNVIRSTPDDAHARAVLGLTYFAMEDFTRAAQTISPISDRAAQDPQLGFALAKSLSELGNKVGAAHALKNLENANSSMNVESRLQSGQLWLELRETKRAEQAFRRALLADPKNHDAICALGIILLTQSKPKEAADLFLSVLADHPDDPQALFQLGRTSLELRNLPEAIRYMEEAARLQPANVSVHLALENAYRKAGRMSDADRENAISETLEDALKKTRDSKRKGHKN
ncbi:MAG: hypothetical protein PVS2B2_09340 [Candidatus Acidiferrum sp.]